MDKLQIEKTEQKRLVWAVTRSVMENDNYKRRKYGIKTRKKWSWFEFLIQIFGLLLKLTPLYKKGCKNAQTIVVNEVDVYFDNLPEDFDGYTILHMTDLHLDSLPELDKRIGINT